LNAAYDCLSDERKRQVYDAYGAEASEQMAHDQDNGRGDAGSGFGFHRRGHGHGDISPEDIFNMFFQVSRYYDLFSSLASNQK
jgi:DnaJ family protein B protein 12